MAEETKTTETAKAPVDKTVIHSNPGSTTPKRTSKVLRAEDFAEGDAVVYIPNHAKGDVNHEDVQEGIVTGMNGPSQLVFVQFAEGAQHTVINPQNLEKKQKPDAVAKP